MLDCAVRQHDAGAVLSLVREGADPDRPDVEGLTPLMIAAGHGHLHIAELLLTAGADVRRLEPRMGATALHKAAQSGSADVVGLLLQYGAFIDMQTPVVGHTALMDAVLHKHEGVVRLLLARGARTTPVSHAGQTVMELARSDGHEGIIRLIAARIDADAALARSQTLIAAVRQGDLVEVERLIATGCAIDERTPLLGSADDDTTALALAAREGHTEIARALLAAGADVRCVSGTMKATPLHEAAYFGHAEVVRLLAEQGVVEGRVPGIDVQGAYNGLSPLHDAVWHGHMAAARALVESGAPLDLRSHAGLTPYALAVLYGYADIAQLLGGAETGCSVAVAEN